MKGTLRKFAGAALLQIKKPTTAQNIRKSSVAFSSPASKMDIPEKCDVCIIGGGAMGSSTAYWLKQHPVGKNLNVVVIERDPKYTKASTVLSLGGIRQQFSNGENVQLSLFGMDFLRNIHQHLDVPGQTPVDVQYYASPYVFIATTPQGAETLHENHLVQTQLGSKVQLLTKEMLKERYPCVNVDDVVLASIGIENEGWFDPWSLLNAFKNKAMQLGVQYVQGEVVGFEKKESNLEVGPTNLLISDGKGDIKGMDFSQCVIAAGYDSGMISKLAGIGSGKDVMSVGVPVEPKKRYVYFIHSPQLSTQHQKDFPLLIDSTGVYVRPEGKPGNYFTGRSPACEEDEPSCENLDVDYSFFDEQIWPVLANRIPALESCKVKSAWGGYYDYNTFDQNGIIGTHPVYKNFHIATGFSGHGIQQSPAAGRAIMELILDGSYKTIDLTKFGFERLVEKRQVLEKNIV